MGSTLRDRAVELNARLRSIAIQCGVPRQDLEDVIQNAMMSFLQGGLKDKIPEGDLRSAVERACRAARTSAVQRLKELDLESRAVGTAGVSDLAGGLGREVLPSADRMRAPKQPAGTIEVATYEADGTSVPFLADEVIPAVSWVTPMVTGREYYGARVTKTRSKRVGFARLRHWVTPSRGARIAAVSILEDVVRRVLENQAVDPVQRERTSEVLSGYLRPFS